MPNIEELLFCENTEVEGSVTDQRTKPVGELEPYVLSPNQSDRSTRVDAHLSLEQKTSVKEFLKKYVLTFAFKPGNMPRINPNVMKHELNVDPSIPPVKQKKGYSLIIHRKP